MGSFVTLLLFHVSCSSRQSELEKLAATEHHLGQLRMAHVEMVHPFITSYFAEIRARLATRSKLKDGPTIVFASNTPFAYSVGNGVVVLSTRLLRSLSNEAELAFIIAHELGHDVLHHEDRDEETYKLEEEADSFAVGAMALAGYDPRASLSALTNTHRYEISSDQQTTHPSLEARLAELSLQIHRSGWQPPGTLHKRDFYKLKKLIS